VGFKPICELSTTNGSRAQPCWKKLHPSGLGKWKLHRSNWVLVRGNQHSTTFSRAEMWPTSEVGYQQADLSKVGLASAMYVRTLASRLVPLAVLFGVLQGSVVGPILFLLYFADLLQLVKQHGLHPHCYADDTQIYGFCDLSDVDALQEHLLVCIDEFFSRMMSNRLQLNTAKTEVLCATSASYSSLCWWHICVACTISSRLRSLYWCRWLRWIYNGHHPHPVISLQ